MIAFLKKGPFSALILGFGLFFMAPLATAEERAQEERQSLRGVQQVELLEGEVRSLPARGIRRVSIPDHRVAKFSASSDGRTFSLEGISAGEAQLEVTFDGEERPQLIRILVDAASDEFYQELTIHKGEMEVFSARGIRRVSVADSEIAFVENNEECRCLEIHGLEVGETLIHFYGSSSRRMETIRIIVATE